MNWTVLLRFCLVIAIIYIRTALDCYMGSHVIVFFIIIILLFVFRMTMIGRMLKKMKIPRKWRYRKPSNPCLPPLVNLQVFPNEQISNNILKRRLIFFKTNLNPKKFNSFKLRHFLWKYIHHSRIHLALSPSGFSKPYRHHFNCGKSLQSFCLPYVYVLGSYSPKQRHRIM